MTGLSLIIVLSAVILLLGLAFWGGRVMLAPSSWLLGGVLVLTALLLLFDVGSLYPQQTVALFWRKCALVAEGMMVPLWLLCSISYARKPGAWRHSSKLVRMFVLISLIPAILPILLPADSFFYFPDFPNERVLFLSSAGYYYYIVIMSFLILSLLQFETTLTNAPPQALWNIKFHLIGLCLILAVQVFYYSQALLYRTLNLEYAQFRSLMFLVACLLMGFGYLKRDTDVKITISRQVALKSVVLFAIGVYLLLLGLFGEGMQYFSGSFLRSVGVSLAFLTGLGLLLLMLSTRARREITVILHKNFYQNKYDYRTQWLMLTDRLSTPLWDDMLQALLEEYCTTFGVEGAALFLYEEQQGGYLVAAEYQMTIRNEVISPRNSLVTFMQTRGWVFYINDYVAEVMDENKELFADYSVSFVVPLPGDTIPEGFIVLGKVVKPDEAYIYEDFDLMKTYARQALQAIRQHRLSRDLSQSREAAAIGNVATFVMHDLKNQVAALSLVAENAPRLIDNAEFQKDLLISLQTTVQNMQRMIGNLKTLDSEKHLRPEFINMFNLLEECALQMGHDRVLVTGPQVTVLGDRLELQKVVMNLLVNAIEASQPGETVSATLEVSDDSCCIRITDTGCGMTQQFIQSELFVPFHSTKPTGLGIGLFQCRQIIQAHGGIIDVASSPGQGTTFTIRLPIKQEQTLS